MPILYTPEHPIVYKQPKKPVIHPIPLSGREEELVLVITAAISGYMDSAFRIKSIKEGDFVVKPMKRVMTSNPWVMSSRMSNTNGAV
jgi:hypothetical protein